MYFTQEGKKMDEQEQIEIRGSMGMEDVVRLQMNRCNASAYEPDQTIFYSNVKVLLDILPPFKRSEIIKRKKDYTTKEKKIEYDYWCGKPMTATKREVIYTKTDFHKLYQMILDAFLEIGYTYQLTKELIEKGKSSTKKKIKKPMKEDAFVKK